MTEWVDCLATMVLALAIYSVGVTGHFLWLLSRRAEGREEDDDAS